MSERSLDDWLALLETRHPVDIELGLERISAVADRLAVAPLARRAVVVGGTNGKGSCVRVLENLALASGLKVAAYTSPHIVSFTERLRVDGEEIADTDWCRAFEAVESVRGKTPLTYFETATLAAMVLIRSRDVDLAILEVGLGGRLDAVNIVDTDLAVITSIDIDHTDWLGTTRGEIAIEKAGVARAGRPVVCADGDPPRALRDALDRLGAIPLYIGADFRGLWGETGLTVSLRDSVGSTADGEVTIVDLPAPQLPLPSVLAALQTGLLLDMLPDGKALAAVVAGSRLAGRFQVIAADAKTVVLDVAHNPAAAVFLEKRLAAMTCRGQILCVAAIMADKSVGEFIDALGGRVDRWFVGDLPGNRRALPGAHFRHQLECRGCEANLYPAIQDAFDNALSSAGNDDIIVVCGSFYTVSSIVNHLGGAGK